MAHFKKNSKVDQQFLKKYFQIKVIFCLYLTWLSLICLKEVSSLAQVSQPVVTICQQLWEKLMDMSLTNNAIHERIVGEGVESKYKLSMLSLTSSALELNYKFV